MKETVSIFAVTHQDVHSRARTGVLSLPHGPVKTPVFMPVGTNSTVKAMTKDDLEEIGFEIILSNTYHLYLRPGTPVIETAGGLHAWSAWQRNILTDSGGFQVFSLAPFRKITEEGVRFRSHIDGSYHLLTPEKIVEIQTILGSDIQMPLDVCTSWDTEYKQAQKAVVLTSDWLKRAKQTWLEGPETYQGLLFGIVQGNFYKDLRTMSLEQILEINTPGIAIGGLSVGEPEDVFSEYLDYITTQLPVEKPCYVMGIGTPQYILKAVECGVDMFDCVLPTRIARNGMVFSQHGPVSLKKEKYTFDMAPIDATCTCKVCKEYSLSYLRHLYKSSEILSAMLATYHNLHFLQNLMRQIREAIEANCFREFKKTFLEKYEGK